jgi:hypothetical protein
MVKFTNQFLAEGDISDVSISVDNASQSLTSLPTNGDTRSWYPNSLIVGVFRVASSFYGQFIGQLSNLRIYNRAISQEEITAIYEYEKPQSTTCLTDVQDRGLIAHYPLQTNSQDISINGEQYDGTDYGVTYDGSSVVFDGVNDYIDLGNIDFSTNDITVSVWVNGVDKSENRYMLMCDNGSNPEIFFYIQADTGYLRFGANAFPSGSQYISPTSGDVFNGDWNLATYVYKNIEGLISFYVNDTLISSHSLSDTGVNLNNQRTWVGDKYGDTSSRQFKGSMSNLRIYNRALEAEEIANLYLEGY